MPTYPEHYLLAFGGHLGPDSATHLEQWTCTLRLCPSGLQLPTFGADVIGPMLDDVWGDLTKFWLASGSKFAASTWLSWAKLNRIGTNGRYTEPITHEVQHNPVAGLNASITPWQCSVVMGLSTAQARGRASKGRMYLPPQAQSINADGRMSATDRDGILQNFAQLIRDINNWPGIDALTGLNLAVHVVSSIDGTHRPVTAVRAGRVIDTHRSRRTSLTEDYGTIAL